MNVGSLAASARYVSLFDAPGAVRFVVAGFVARLTVSMSSLGLVLALSRQHGYGLAGSVTGLFSLASAIAAPRIGRMYDRHGQSRILPALALVFGTALGLMICATARDWPTWTLFPLAALAGAALPVVGPLIRARWTALYRGSEKLRSSYAFEAATDEAVYIVGPILVTALATGLGPLAGLAAVLGCALSGTLALAAQRATEPEPALDAPARGTAKVMRLPAMRTLFAVMLGVGGVFGSMEIVTVGFASHEGHRGSSGLLLSLWAISSLVTGLVYGAVTVRAALHRRFELAVAAFALGMTPLLLARSILGLSLLLVVAGLAMSVTLVTAMEVVERVVPRASLTEGISWYSGGIGLGMTLGGAAGGWAVDRLGAVHAFSAPAAFGTFALVMALSRRHVLRDACCLS